MNILLYITKKIIIKRDNGERTELGGWMNLTRKGMMAHRIVNLKMKNKSKKEKKCGGEEARQA